jgi:hypothetical protein
MEPKPLRRIIKGWDTLRLPRLGVIQLGEKDEKGVPRSLDYFVCPEEVRKVYGDRPRRLDIAFPVDDITVIFPSQLERYGDQFGRICTGDGERANLSVVYARGEAGQREYGVVPTREGFVSATTGEQFPVVKGQGGKEYVQIPCLYRACPVYRAGKCREVGRLNFLLPKVPGMLGIYQIATGSVNSYLNVAGALSIFLKMLAVLNQPIWTVTLQLEVRLEHAHPVIGEAGAERQVRTVVPVLYVLKDDMTLEEFVRQAASGALSQRPAVMLPAGVKVEIEEPDEDEKPELLFPPESEVPQAPVPGGPGENLPVSQTGSQPVPPGPAEQQAVSGQQGAGGPAAHAPKPAARQSVAGPERAAARAPKPAAPEPVTCAPKTAEQQGQGGPAAPARGAVGGQRGTYGTLEVMAPPVVRKDPQDGSPVVVVQVRIVEGEDGEVGRVCYAFSEKNVHEFVRQVMQQARPGDRLLFGGYFAREDALVVQQAVRPGKDD